MIEERQGEADVARCDSCGAADACTEECDRHGQRKRAWLPAGWRLMDGKHLCGACVADNAALFAPVRPQFERHFDQLGRGLVADIAAKLRVPPDLAWDWVFEIERSFDGRLSTELDPAQDDRRRLLAA